MYRPARTVTVSLDPPQLRLSLAKQLAYSNHNSLIPRYANAVVYIITLACAYAIEDLNSIKAIIRFQAPSCLWMLQRRASIRRNAQRVEQTQQRWRHRRRQ